MCPDGTSDGTRQGFICNKQCSSGASLSSTNNDFVYHAVVSATVPYSHSECTDCCILSFDSPDDLPCSTGCRSDTASCHMCNITCPNSLSFGEHLNSKKHKMRALGSASSECKVCDKIFTSPSQYEQHLSGKKHKKQAMRSAMTNGNPQATDDPGAGADGNGGVDIIAEVSSTAAAAATRARARAAALAETSEEIE